MTIVQAASVLGLNRTQWEVANMARALSLMSWLNGPEETQRLAAARYVLKRLPYYAAHCNAMRDKRHAR